MVSSLAPGHLGDQHQVRNWLRDSVGNKSFRCILHVNTGGLAGFNKCARITSDNAISGNIEILGNTTLISSGPLFKCTVFFDS